MVEKSLLISFATRYGSARIVAEDLVEQLKSKDVKITLVDLKKDRFTGKLSDYDLVVLGSSIAMFSWTFAAKKFLRKCRKSAVETAVYITCGTAIEKPEEAKSRFFDKVVSRIGIKPVATAILGPVIDFRSDGLPEKTKQRVKGTMKSMFKDDFQENGLMDMRNSQRFTAFVEDLRKCLDR